MVDWLQVEHTYAKGCQQFTIEGKATFASDERQQSTIVRPVERISGVIIEGPVKYGKICHIYNMNDDGSAVVTLIAMK